MNGDLPVCLWCRGEVVSGHSTDACWQRLCYVARLRAEGRMA